MKKELNFIIGSVALILALAGGIYLYLKSTKSAALPVQETVAASIAPEANERLIRDYSAAQGPLLARVTVVEFLDPECESCRAMHPLVKKVLADYGGRLRYVVRYMPYHHNSLLAATALEAAAEQDKYWELLDKLFEKQLEWGEKQTSQKELIVGYVKSLGLNMKRFTADMQKPELAARITQDKEDGTHLGVRGTPSFFVNGKMLMALGESELRSAIELEFAGATGSAK